MKKIFITVNNQKYEIENPSDTLLVTLLKLSLPIRYQCLSGICGVCKCKKIKGDVHYHQEVLAHLGGDEILTCITTAVSDIEIIL